MMAKKGPDNENGTDEVNNQKKNGRKQDEFPIFHSLLAENPRIVFREIIAKITKHDKIKDFIFEIIAMQSETRSREYLISYFDETLEAAERMGLASIDVIKTWEEVLDAIEDWWRRGEQSKVQKEADEIGGRIMINISEIVARSRVFRREAREKTGMEPQPRKKSPYSIVMPFPHGDDDDTEPAN